MWHGNRPGRSFISDVHKAERCEKELEGGMGVVGFLYSPQEDAKNNIIIFLDKRHSTKQLKQRQTNKTNKECILAKVKLKQINFIQRLWKVQQKE